MSAASKEMVERAIKTNKKKQEDAKTPEEFIAYEKIIVALEDELAAHAPPRIGD